MHRKGHVGMTLLAFAPVAYVLISEGKPIFAALCFLGVQTVEPWPDQDFHLPFLTHRGVSHSLLAILVVGGILGAVGWFLGGNLFDLLLAALLAGGDLFGWVLGLLPDATADMINLLLPNISLEAVVAHAHRIAGESVNQWTFAAYGLFVGTYGVFAHLLGDVITMSGIKPFLPLSRWRLSLSSLHADSPTANSSLFFLGVLALAVVLGATVSGAVLGAVTHANLSPVGVASAQDAGPLVAENGSVTINETESNRTRIILDSVTLPQNGYIVAQTIAGSNVTNQSATKATVVGHTQFVRAGSYQDVVLQLNQSVPVGTVISVTLHNDTDSDRTLDVGPDETDSPYRTSSGTPIHDSFRLEVAGRVNASVTGGLSNQTDTQTQNSTNSSSGAGGNVSANAAVVFRNQTTNGTSVTISSVTLSEGGFVAIHGSAYSQQGIVSESTIAVSRYLKPGTHHNVTISFERGVPGAVGNTSEFEGAYAPLSAVVYADTNGNKHYDYVASFGTEDAPYQRSGTRVDDQARVVTQEQLDRKSRATAAVTLSNQSAADGTLTVARVRVPRGGWVVIHNRTYLTENDPLTSAVGHSKYLSPGVHRNVTVALDRPLDRSQSVVAVAYHDTNGNQRYDYIRSGGMADYGYVNRSANATLVTDRAHVSVPSPATTSGHTPSPATADAPRTSTTQAVATTNRPPASGGVLSGVPIWIKGLLVVVGVVLGLTLIGRVT